jgi:hypothetical protein
MTTTGSETADRNWVPLFPKSSSKTSSTADYEIFNIRRLLLAQKPLRKTRTQGPKNHPVSLLRLTMKSSMYVDYCLPWNHWGKLGPRDPKINQQAKFYGWRYHLQRTKTTTGSETVDRNWVHLFPKSSSKSSSTADDEIFNVRRLLLALKPLRKTRTRDPKIIQ